MLQAPNTNLFNPLVPKSTQCDSERQNQLFPLQIKPVKSVKASLRILFSCTLGTNGLS